MTRRNNFDKMIIWKYYQTHTVQETARKFNIPQGTVYKIFKGIKWQKFAKIKLETSTNLKK